MKFDVTMVAFFNFGFFFVLLYIHSAAYGEPLYANVEKTYPEQDSLRLVDRVKRDVQGSLSSTAAPPTHTISEHHTYYHSHLYRNTQFTQPYLNKFDEIFKEGFTIDSLSNHSSKYKKVTLKSPILFYGHYVSSVGLTTGGFVAVTDYLHRYIAFSQYAAPLMAPFAPSRSQDSHVIHKETDEAFWVYWKNMHLAYDTNFTIGSFSFQMALFRNGSVLFAYRKIPITADKIDDSNHYVRAGLADAYYFDVYEPSRGYVRYIVNYHRVKLPMNETQTGAVVLITPYPTCVQQKSCASCTNLTNFSCSWCPAKSRCSSGVDRHRQDWLKSCQNNLRTCVTPSTPTTPKTTTPCYGYGCHGTTQPPTKTSAKPTRPSGATPCTSYGCHGTTQPPTKTNFRPDRPDGTTPCTSTDVCPEGKRSEVKSGKAPGMSSTGIVSLVLIMCIMLTLIIVGVFWVRYAYRHPTSPMGIWLIEHRPQACCANCCTSSSSPADNYAVSLANNETQFTKV